MGNWNRRYMPRKKYRQYDDYNDPPPSYNYDSHSSGLGDRRVPSWEIDYCYSARVPWNKILASKKYIYSYPSVLDWDGSAAKEALENAKQRYWAMINGLPCENPLPDPDMYIGEIDWNPYVDPELMADLQDFNPDEAQTEERLEAINEDAECARTPPNKNQYTSDNPWERDHVLSNESSKGWGRWGDAVNLKNDDPWEQSCQKLVDSSMENVWRSGNESWNCNEKTVSVRQDGWGCGQENGWGQVQRENYSGNGWGCGQENGWGLVQREDNSGTISTSFGNNNTIGSKERGWRDNRNASWGVRGGNEVNHWEPNFRRGRWSSRGGGRKRESSVQHSSKYKSSRYLGDFYGYGHQM